MGIVTASMIVIVCNINTSVKVIAYLLKAESAWEPGVYNENVNRTCRLLAIAAPAIDGVLRSAVESI